jgi:ABC-type glycerol-3-phosphate transport system permease component
MKMKTLRVVGLLFSLILVGASTGNGTLELMVQQIQDLGPGPWLRLMAGAVVSKLPVPVDVARMG